jgi:hypothetical protein
LAKYNGTAIAGADIAHAGAFTDDVRFRLTSPSNENRIQFGTSGSMYIGSDGYPDRLYMKVPAVFQLDVASKYIGLNSSTLFLNAVIRQDLDGTAAAPSYTFGSDTDTGMYYPGANRLGFSVDGVQRLELNDDTTGGLTPRAIVTGALTFSPDATHVFGHDGVSFARPNTVYSARYFSAGSGTDIGSIQLSSSTDNSLEFTTDGVGVIGAAAGNINSNRRPAFIKIKEQMLMGDHASVSGSVTSYPNTLRINSASVAIGPMLASSAANPFGSSFESWIGFRHHNATPTLATLKGFGMNSGSSILFVGEQVLDNSGPSWNLYFDTSSGVVHTRAQVEMESNTSLASAANVVKLGAYDVAGTDTRRSLAIATEEPVAVDVIAASTHTLAVTINGTTYKILLST